MDWQNGLFLLLALIIAVTAWAGVLFVIPWCQRGQFRQNLWRLRDEITDDVIDGKLSYHPAVNQLREHIDFSIRYAQDITFANLMVVLVSAGRVLRAQIAAAEPGCLEGLPPDQAARLGEYRRRFGKLVSKHIISGSPSGWLAAILIFLLLRPYWRFTGNGTNQTRPKDVVARTVSEEGVPLTDLLAASRRRSRRRDSDRPLSACY